MIQLPLSHTRAPRGKRLLLLLLRRRERKRGVRPKEEGGAGGRRERSSEKKKKKEERKVGRPGLPVAVKSFRFLGRREKGATGPKAAWVGGGGVGGGVSEPAPGPAGVAGPHAGTVQGFSDLGGGGAKLQMTPLFVLKSSQQRPQKSLGSSGAAEGVRRSPHGE